MTEDLKKAARRFVEKFIIDGDPNTLLIPAEIEAEGQDAVNEFATAFNDLSKALTD